MSEAAERANDRELRLKANRLLEEVVARQREAQKPQTTMPTSAVNAAGWKMRKDQRLFDPWREWAAPSFPFETLPVDIQEYVDSKSEEIGACKSALAMACLAVASGALSHECKLVMVPGGSFKVSPRLWVLLAGDPSAKKSPIISTAMAPMVTVECELDRKAWGEYEATVKAVVESGASKKEIDEAKRREPSPTQYILDDFTSEKLCDILSSQQRGILINADELAGLIGQLDRYGAGTSGGSSTARTVLLRAYDGTRYKLARIMRKAKPVENLSVSILGGIQPARLREMGNLESDGLMQRFLPVMMSKSRLASTQFDRSAWRSWDSTIRRLVETPKFKAYLEPEAQDERERMLAKLHVLGQNDTEGAGFQTVRR